LAAVLEAAQEFGIEPIPDKHRVLSAWDSFVLWADLGISFLVMVVGTLLVPGLGLGAAVLAILVGAVIGNVLLGVGARIGSETRVPTMVLLRGPLGLRGSYAPTVLNILQLIGWATFEAIVVGQAADAVVARAFGLPNTYHVWVIIFTAVTLLLALGGPILVTKQWLKKFAFWAVLLSTVWMTVALLTSINPGALLAQPGTGELSFWLAVDLVVALPISWFPLVADYSRFSRSGGAAFWGTGLGYFGAQVWFYILGALLTLAGGLAADPDAPIAPLVAAIAGLTAGWAALVVLMVDETKEGFANVYSTAVSIQNLLPRLSQRMLIVVVSAVMLVLAWVVPLAQYESFLLLIGSLFVPLLAILTADYFLLRGGHYQAEDLLRPGGAYWYRGGINWLGIGTWVVGVAVYLVISGLPAFGVDGLVPWLGASLPSFIVAFALHTLLGRFAVRRQSEAVVRAA
jgi:putative hydroxymethylpyrimidine transporter CytX